MDSDKIPCLLVSFSSSIFVKSEFNVSLNVLEMFSRAVSQSTWTRLPQMSSVSCRSISLSSVSSSESEVDFHWRAVRTSQTRLMVSKCNSQVFAAVCRCSLSLLNQSRSLELSRVCFTDEEGESRSI